MKILILSLIVFVFFPSHSWAKFLRIDSKLYHSGKKIGSPRVLTAMGERSKMFVKDTKTNKDYSLEVVARRVSKKIIQLNYSLSIKERNNEILTRGSIKIASGSSGRVLLDRRRAEIHFKLKEVDKIRAVVRN